MKKLFPLMAVIATLALATACKTSSLTTETKDMKTKFDDEIDKNRVVKKFYRKEDATTKYVRRTKAGRVRTFVYDYKLGKFVCDSGDMDPTFQKCADCSEGCNPPYEIHEMDAIRIKIKNINPFLYKVDLYELQGDQISNENLIEGNLSRSLSLTFEKVNAISVERSGLSVTTDRPTLDTKVEKAKKLNQEIEDLQNQIDAKQKTVGAPGGEFISEVATLKTAINSKSGELIVLREEINAGTNVEKVKTKEMTLRDELERVQQCVNFINRLIQSHNQIIYLVYSPMYTAADLENAMNKIAPYTEEELLERYLQNQQTLNDLINENLGNVNELKRLDGIIVSGTPSYKTRVDLYNDIKINLSALDNTMETFSGDKLVAQINFLKKMVNENNFTVLYETHSIADNADYLKYKIEFKPNTLGNLLPQGVSPSNLELAFKIREGLKLDISSGFVLDIGLTDPTYYFDRTTDMTAQKVFVRENEHKGNVNPSIAAFLNAYKRTSTNFKFGGAFGLGLSNSARIRLYMGPSLIVGRKERIVMTAGVSFGPTSRLADGYSVGLELDNNSSLPESVPTVLDRYKFGGFFGIGFNLTGKQNKNFLEKLKFN